MSLIYLNLKIKQKKMKIELKDIYNNIIFSHTCENNSFKKTLEEAVRQEIRLDNLIIEFKNLSNINLENAFLNYTTFYNCNLTYANFKNSSINNCIFINNDLHYARFKKSRVFYSKFETNSLNELDFSNTIQDDNYFTNCDMTRIKFDYSILENLFLTFNNLIYSSFINTTINKSSFLNCTLRFTNFRFSTLNFVEYNNGSLEFSNFKETTLNKVRFIYNNLYQVKFDEEEKEKRINKILKSSIKGYTYIDNVLVEYTIPKGALVFNDLWKNELYRTNIAKIIGFKSDKLDKKFNENNYFIEFKNKKYYKGDIIKDEDFSLDYVCNNLTNQYIIFHKFEEEQEKK